MAFWDGLSKGGLVATGGAAAVIAVAGYFGLMRPAAVAPLPAAVEVTPTAEVAKPAEAVVAPVAAEEIKPSFDVVRVAPDGAATVAGAAAAGAVVSLQVDGAEVANATADSQGKFAALFTLAPSPVARMLTLAAKGADGVVVLGAQTVAIAPIAVPEMAAAAASVAQAPAALLVEPEGVKVLQSAVASQPEVAANISIVTITYAPDGAVVLGGHGGPKAALRVYLDGKQLADAVVDDLGIWKLKLAGVEPGLYTLRVDQLDAAGKVTSRFETPFKRETLEALAKVAEAATATTEVVTAQTTDVAATAPEAPAVAEVAPKVDAVTESEPLAQTAAASQAEPTAAVEKPAVAPVAPVTITVQPGFTLWGIAKQNFGDGVMYVQVFDANKDKIKNPDLIYPGQVFTIPTQP